MWHARLTIISICINLALAQGVYTLARILSCRGWAYFLMITSWYFTQALQNQIQTMASTSQHSQVTTQHSHSLQDQQATQVGQRGVVAEDLWMNFSVVVFIPDDLNSLKAAGTIMRPW